MTTSATIRPATSGKCGTVGCRNEADLESQTRTGPNRWAVALTCFGHASDETMARVHETSAR